MTSILQICPVEIISAIIDIVAQIDEEDEDTISQPLENVWACCLTCRALVPLCRKHIFYSLSLRISYNPYILNATSRATSFLALLEKSAEIAHDIRRLDIHDLVSDPEYYSDSEHHSHCTSLVSVMQAFTRLSSISLYGSMVPVTDWKAIPACVRRALLRIIGLPTVTHLYFSGFMNFDLSILARCVGLRNLTLFKFDFAQNNELSSSVFVAQPVQLTQLEVQLCGTSVLRRLVSQKCGDGSSMFVFEQLKTFFAIFWTIEEVASATTFFKSVRVEVLDISFRHAQTAADTGGALAEMVPNFKSLKDFSFSICLNQKHIDLIPRCCKPLRDMSTGKNSLEVIHIGFEISFGYSFNRDEWSELEDTLLAPGWLHLKQVNFAICADFKDWDPEDQSFLREALDLPRKQLQRLTPTKRFSFSFNLDIGDEDEDEEDEDEDDGEDDDEDEDN